MFVCVCMFVCVFACVGLGAFKNPPRHHVCMLFVVRVCMFVCVCVCLCVCVCVCWPRRVQKPHVYPSDNGLVPTRSGGCTPRVWPTPCGVDFERNANPTFHLLPLLPVQPTSRPPICFPLLSRRCHARRVRGALMVRHVNKGKQIDTHIHTHTYTH